MTGPSDAPPPVRLGPLRAAAQLIAVALISFALIAYEIEWMRRLLIERWHHFGYLVISAALLGFGASGTLLALLERSVRRRTSAVLLAFGVLLYLALLLAPRLAAALPIQVQFAPHELWHQVGWWALYWLAAGLPFFFGAALIGAALTTAGDRIGHVYAVNLVGSALGALVAALALSHCPVPRALWPSLAASLVATGLLATALVSRKLARVALISLAVFVPSAASVAIEWRWPLHLRYDEFKYAAYVERLANQGSANRLGAAPDPYGYVEIYESALFHDLPFLALSEPPPPLDRVLLNGDPAGSIFRIRDASQADVMDRTLMALPYRLIPSQPRVLLLGETGGTNVWLARRCGASAITVSQPNRALLALLRGPLLESSAGVFTGSDLHVSFSDARGLVLRHFIGKRLPYDLIQFASLEGLGTGAHGVHGLAEDHLLTVEGLADCLARLTPDGGLAFCRGVQFPERENVRLIATLIEALESLGIRDPQRHLVVLRDYLGVCTVALRSPLDDARRTEIERLLADLQLTPVWYDGLPLERVNRPDELPGPPGTRIDWLHHAVSELLSPRREAFYRSWLLNVRPAQDDSPFFWDFYKPGAGALLRRVYGDLWLTRAELGRLFLYASLAVSAAAAVVLILLPLLIAQVVRTYGRRRASRQNAPPVSWRQTGGALVYFAAIGLAFMGVEMALISRTLHGVGDPVLASALVIGGLLVLSGCGSLTVRPGRIRAAWRRPALAALLTLLVALLAWSGPTPLLCGLTPSGAALVAVVLAVAMGRPMPSGLARLGEHTGGPVPWAWGVNGVASVVGSSLAIVVAMTVGYRYVFLAAVGLYLLAAAAAPFLRPTRLRIRGQSAARTAQG